MGRAVTRGGLSRRRAAVALLGAGALATGALAGCGGSATESAPPSSAATSEATSALAGLTADQVLARTKTAAQSAKSVRVTGDISTDGQSITIDLRLAGVARGSGTVIQDGGRIDLVRLGNDIYFKADEKTLSETVAQGDAKIVKLIAGRYVKATVDTEGFADFAGLLDFVAFVEGVLSPDGTVSRVDGKPIAGVPTVGLKDNDPDSSGVLYVADRGEPYPLQVEPASGPGIVTMSDWNTDITITPPPADQVIDFGALG